MQRIRQCMMHCYGKDSCMKTHMLLMLRAGFNTADAPAQICRGARSGGDTVSKLQLPSDLQRKSIQHSRVDLGGWRQS